MRCATLIGRHAAAPRHRSRQRREGPRRPRPPAGVARPRADPRRADVPRRRAVPAGAGGGRGGVRGGGRDVRPPARRGRASRRASPGTPLGRLARERVAAAAARTCATRACAPRRRRPGSPRPRAASSTSSRRSASRRSAEERPAALGGRRPGPRAPTARTSRALYAAYRARLDRLAGRDVPLHQARGARRAARAAARAGATTPVLFYGFDDLRPLQLDAVLALARTDAEVTVSLTYEPGRHAFAARGETFHALDARGGHARGARRRSPTTTRPAPATRCTTSSAASSRRPSVAPSLFDAPPEVPSGEAVVPHGGRRRARRARARGRRGPAPDRDGGTGAGGDRGRAAPPGRRGLPRRAGLRRARRCRSPSRARCASATRRSAAASSRCCAPRPAGRRRTSLGYLRTPGRVAQAVPASTGSSATCGGPACGTRPAPARGGRRSASRSTSSTAWPTPQRAGPGDAARPPRGRAARPVRGAVPAQRARARRRARPPTPSSWRRACARCATSRSSRRRTPSLVPGAARARRPARRAAGPPRRARAARCGDRQRPAGPARAARARAVRRAACRRGSSRRPARPEPFFGDDERRRLTLASGLRLRMHEDALGAERYLLYATVSRPSDRLVPVVARRRRRGRPRRALGRSSTTSPACSATDPLERAPRRDLGAVGGRACAAPCARRRTPSRRVREPVAAAAAPPRGAGPAARPAGVVGVRPRGLGRVPGEVVRRAAAAAPTSSSPTPSRCCAATSPTACSSRRVRRLVERGALTPSRLPEAREAIARGARRARPRDAALGRPVARARARGAGWRPTSLRYVEAAAHGRTRFVPARFEETFDGLDLGEGVTLRGTIDRIDVRESRRAARGDPRDYKGKNAPAHAKWLVRAQVPARPLRARRARELLDLEPVGALYQPLGAEDMRAARRAARRTPTPTGRRTRTTGSTREEFDELLDEAVAVALQAAREARAGALEPRPDTCAWRGGCAYPTICRCDGVSVTALIGPERRRSRTSRRRRSLDDEGDLLLSAAAGSGQDLGPRRALRPPRAGRGHLAGPHPRDHVHREGRGRAARARPRAAARARRCATRRARPRARGSPPSTASARGCCAAHAVAAGPRSRASPCSTRRPARALRDEAWDQAFARWLDDRGDAALDLSASFTADPLRARGRPTVHDALRSAGQTAPRLPAPGAGARRPTAPTLLRARARRRRASSARGERSRPSRRRSTRSSGARRSSRRSAPARCPRPARSAARAEAGGAAALKQGAPRRLPRGARGVLQAPARRTADAARAAELDALLDALRRRVRGGKRARSALDFDDLELLARDLLRGRARRPRRVRRALRAGHGRRVPGLEPAAGRAVRPARPRQRLRGRRRAAVDLRLPPRRRRGLPPAPRRARPRGRALAADAELPLAAGDHRRGQRRVRAALRRGVPAARRPAREAAADGAPRVELLLTEQEGWDDVDLGDLPRARSLAPGRGAAASPSASATSSTPARRAPEDVVVLLRATGDLPVFERALEDAGLQTLAAGGRGYWGRQVVRDLCAWLAALANPRDEEQLYGVLASPLVGASTDALALVAEAGKGARGGARARVRCAGGDRRRAVPRASRAPRSRAPRRGRPRAARGVPRALRARARARAAPRARRAAAAGVEAADYDLHVLRLPGRRAAAGERPQARCGSPPSTSAAHGRDVRGLVDRANAELEADAREADAPVELGDAKAVRLMTIHAAKGLEFPVVVVADLGRRSRRRRARAARRRRPARRCGSRTSTAARSRRSTTRRCATSAATAERRRRTASSTSR